MAKRSELAADVLTMGYDRLYQEYRAGHRLLIATSGGKDSIVCTELAIKAATDAGRLPVEVCTRDEEIMLPGTFEYLERLAERPEVRFYHMVARMPIVNAFSRKTPLWWTFDPLLDPEQWVRQPPAGFLDIPEKHQRWMVNARRFPVGVGPKVEAALAQPGAYVDPTGQERFEGQRLYSVTGIRTAESPMRLLALHSSGKAMGWDKAHLTGLDTATGYHGLRPIYDWEDGDVWRFIRDGWGGEGLDYNHAYDTMLRMGVPRRNLRIAPPTMRAASMKSLRMVSGAWPRWFDRVCKRVEGVRTAVQYGEQAMRAERRLGETWEQVYARAVTGPGNPEWIRERGATFAKIKLAKHAEHSRDPWPDMSSCPVCAEGGDRFACWRDATKVMYMGDPYSLSQKTLHAMEPEAFRPGAGSWY